MKRILPSLKQAVAPGEVFMLLAVEGAFNPMKHKRREEKSVITTTVAMKEEGRPKARPSLFNKTLRN